VTRQGRLDSNVIRMAKKRSPWTAHLIEQDRLALDLNPTIASGSSLDHGTGSGVSTRTPRGSLCPACKGVRMLCHKTSCPLTAKLYSYLRLRQSLDRTDLDGSSPPGVFVGRYGYPNVLVGPMVPPVHGDTALLDLPEAWFGKTMQQIIDYRFQLVRGQYTADVRRPDDGGRILDDTRFLAMADGSVDVELTLRDKPRKSFVLNDEVQPMGPSAHMKDLKSGNFRLDQWIEKAYYDEDQKAVEAVKEIYDRGTPVSKIMKALSVGAFGTKKRRRLVPTRWSITAVDSMLSLDMMEKVKEYPVINEYRVYESTYLDNRFEVILLPEGWRYEAIEAWYPGTIWNPAGEDIFMFGDSENRHGRTSYAKMGGCYYAARLAVNELLTKERRQATAIVLREAHPDYIMPVGVWQVRENVRNALRNPPLRFSRLEDVLDRMKMKFDIRLATWLTNSTMLTDAMKQTKLSKFLQG
jgi:hypothetical protein